MSGDRLVRIGCGLILLGLATLLFHIAWTTPGDLEGKDWVPLVGAVGVCAGVFTAGYLFFGHDEEESMTDRRVYIDRDDHLHVRYPDGEDIDVTNVVNDRARLRGLLARIEHHLANPMMDGSHVVRARELAAERLPGRGVVPR